MREGWNPPHTLQATADKLNELVHPEGSVSIVSIDDGGGYLSSYSLRIQCGINCAYKKTEHEALAYITECGARETWCTDLRKQS